MPMTPCRKSIGTKCHPNTQRSVARSIFPPLSTMTTFCPLQCRPQLPRRRYRGSPGPFGHVMRRRSKRTTAWRISSSLTKTISSTPCCIMPKGNSKATRVAAYQQTSAHCRFRTAGDFSRTDRRRGHFRLYPNDPHRRTERFKHGDAAHMPLPPPTGTSATSRSGRSSNTSNQYVPTPMMSNGSLPVHIIQAAFVL